MTDPTARAVASVSACGACGFVAWTVPPFGALAVVGIIASMYLIWSRP